MQRDGRLVGNETEQQLFPLGWKVRALRARRDDSAAFGVPDGGDGDPHRAGTGWVRDGPRRAGLLKSQPGRQRLAKLRRSAITVPPATVAGYLHAMPLR